jgi:uncharacterized protein YjbI with pentapeptide repeats
MIRTTWAHRGLGTAALILLLATSAVVVSPSTAQAAGCLPAPRTDLSGCNFANTNLANADLSQDNLTGTNFQGADLDNANLSRSNITAADFTNADLVGADLNHSVVTESCPGAPSSCPGIPYQLTSINYPDAYVTYSSGPNFADADLATAKMAGINLAGSTNVFLGTTTVTVALHVVTFDVYGSFTDAVLTGATSGGIRGRPASLPSGWALIRGNLTLSSGPLQITTMSLPDGTAKSRYAADLAAIGGHPPYKWSVIGSLPPGLHLSRSTGVISGRPEGSGTYSFNVQVADTQSMTNPPTQDTATATLVIVVQ